jgi:hypothetical protein
MTRQLLATFTLLLPLAWAQETAVRMDWTDLGGRLPGNKVALMLPDGTHIQGKAIHVERDGLRMKVTSTSDRKAQPKGTHLIPRKSISVLRVTEYGTRGRMIATLAGLGAAGAAIAAAYPRDLYEGTVLIAVPAATAAGVVGIGVGSYYIGKRIDRHVTVIALEPERP